MAQEGRQVQLHGRRASACSAHHHALTLLPVVLVQAVHVGGLRAQTVREVHAVGFDGRELVGVEADAPVTAAGEDGVAADALDALQRARGHVHLEDLHAALQLEDHQRFPGGLHHEAALPGGGVDLLGRHVGGHVVERAHQIGDLGDHRGRERPQLPLVAVHGDEALHGLPHQRVRVPLLVPDELLAVGGGPVELHGVLAVEDEVGRGGAGDGGGEHVGAHAGREADHVAREGVEHAGGVRRVPGGQHEQPVGGDGDDEVGAEERHAPAVEAARGGVDEEARVDAVGRVVEHDPAARPEARLQRAPRVGRGRAPAVADGAERHVAVDVGGVEKQVGDAVDQLRHQRRPALGVLHGGAPAGRRGGAWWVGGVGSPRLPDLGVWISVLHVKHSRHASG
ncbi:hypothetical protein CFC21_074049 [Triticum aestivum]|uniref:Uncharacterized protein n=2 Tax=Triticum aestivum TaxID=4565 RepID=A0A3B6LTS9_WHEAT|nr:hypothetical protein CFC21_074049 [Triticum aestivum]